MPSHNLYTNNMKLLRAEGTSVSELRIGSFPDFGPFSTLEAASGDMTVVKRSDDTAHQFIHSSVNPRAEASEWANHQKISHETAVVLGMGLGYHITELIGRKSLPASLYVIEADDHLFQTTMDVFDLTPILANPRINLFIGSNQFSFGQFIIKRVCGPFSLHRFLPSTQLHMDTYHRFTSILDERRYDINRHNGSHNGQEMPPAGDRNCRLLLEEMCR